jgi:hypothetical protein
VAIDEADGQAKMRDLGDRIDRERGELSVKAGEHDAGAAGGEGVDVLGFAWWRSGRRCWPSSPR